MNIYNYNHLYYFYVTAKLEGVTVAAKHLNTSQSSLSTQIKTLEDSLGRPLFKKTGRRIELTEFGKELYQYCRRAFEIFEEMSDQINKTPQSMGARISVGVSLEIDRTFVTELLAKVSHDYQKSKRPLLNLLSIGSAELSQSLKIGNIDILLTTKGLIDQNIDLLDNFSLTVGIFASKSIASQIKNLTADEILKRVDLGFVFPSKTTSLRTEIDTYLIKKNLHPSCVFESNIIASVNRAAIDGLGVLIMPDIYVAQEVKNGQLVRLNSKPLWKHQLILLSARGRLDDNKKFFSKKLIENLLKLNL